MEIRLTTTAVSGNLRYPSVTPLRHCRNLTVVSAWKDLRPRRDLNPCYRRERALTGWITL